MTIGVEYAVGNKSRRREREQSPGALAALETDGGIVLATLVGIWLWQREPRYEGYPLGHWLRVFASLRHGLGLDRQEEESAAVLKRTQGKVVPHLIRLLQKKDSAFDEPWPPSPANDVLAAPLRDMAREWGLLPSWEMRHRAAEALGCIGQQAKPAVPDLQRLMLQTDDYDAAVAPSDIHLHLDGIRLNALHSSRTDLG